MTTDEIKKVHTPNRTHCQNCQNLPAHAQTAPNAQPDFIAMAIARDLLPTATAGELAALLANYRSAGAILTLERVDHDGARKLALGVELSAGVAVEAHADLFEQIERDGLALVRALELENAPTIDGGEAALLYAPHRAKELII